MRLLAIARLTLSRENVHSERRRKARAGGQRRKREERERARIGLCFLCFSLACSAFLSLPFSLLCSPLDRQRRLCHVCSPLASVYAPKGPDEAQREREENRIVSLSLSLSLSLTLLSRPPSFRLSLGGFLSSHMCPPPPRLPTPRQLVAEKGLNNKRARRRTWCMTMGLLAKGTSGLGVDSVSGRSRVP